ncbi:hypothetical protein [Avibacterium endocarditidis]|uniref:Uncharacterized protein n=1 Tax=Avibacterium endocarditidis TaxID=380674 RepID=A0ABX4ZRL4_9PAST|nr:hypothetical protein [Avibacterium endocarditidis]POY41885.1 hypothetical protein C3Z13_09200 [Avibacterium endocarditidis]
MKPFDLEKALAGEPVKLCDGRKAYIQGTVPKGYDSDYELVGYAIKTDGRAVASCWTLQGRHDKRWKTSMDIVGMWEEPKPKRFINGIEVPEPVTLDTLKEGNDYWYPIFSNSSYTTSDRFYAKYEIDKNLIEQGLVFETQEGAEAMAKALLNYKVEYKNE